MLDNTHRSVALTHAGSSSVPAPSAIAHRHTLTQLPPLPVPLSTDSPTQCPPHAHHSPCPVLSRPVLFYMVQRKGGTEILHTCHNFAKWGCPSLPAMTPPDCAPSMGSSLLGRGCTEGSCQKSDLQKYFVCVCSDHFSYRCGLTCLVQTESL